MAELIITEPEDPWYISELENQKILFDVNSLLIGILFECSHSANIIRYVHELKNTQIVICPHIYDTAVQILNNKMPAAVIDFKSKLKLLITKGLVISVDNGDVSKLPVGLSFDPSDDDIVMATGLSEGCSKIVTLDTKLALKIADHIEILSPDDQNNSVLRSVMGIEDIAFYNSPREGSVTVGVQPQINSTNYKKSKGRRYVFCTDLGFSCWLNEKNLHLGFAIIKVCQPNFFSSKRKRNLGK